MAIVAIGSGFNICVFAYCNRAIIQRKCRTDSGAGTVIIVRGTSVYGYARRRQAGVMTARSSWTRKAASYGRVIRNEYGKTILETI